MWPNHHPTARNPLYGRWGVKIGVDHTVYAVRDGLVKFQEKKYLNFTGNKKLKQFVSVEPKVETVKAKAPSVKEKPKAEIKKENLEIEN